MTFFQKALHSFNSFAFVVPQPSQSTDAPIPAPIHPPKHNHFISNNLTRISGNFPFEMKGWWWHGSRAEGEIYYYLNSRMWKWKIWILFYEARVVNVNVYGSLNHPHSPWPYRTYNIIYVIIIVIEEIKKWNILNAELSIIHSRCSHVESERRKVKSFQSSTHSSPACHPSASNCSPRWGGDKKWYKKLLHKRI